MTATENPTPAKPTSPTSQAVRPPFWRDVRVLRVVGQVGAVALIAWVVWWLFGNLRDNLTEQGVPTGFGFWDDPTNFQISEDPGFDAREPVWKMVLVGVKNTALAAGVGIAIAVVLGTLIGIARLSTNWLLSRFAQVYVEVFRNIPPLIVIIFFGFAIFTFGPLPAFNPNSPPIQWQLPGTDTNWLILSNSRWGIPSFAADLPSAHWWPFLGIVAIAAIAIAAPIAVRSVARAIGTAVGIIGLVWLAPLLLVQWVEGNVNTAFTRVGAFWMVVVAAAVVAAGVWLWRTRVGELTGQPHRRNLWALGVFAAIVLLAFMITGTPYRFSWPAVSESGRRVEGGFATSAAYISITVALGLYTASHIAEIIRGSILAVPKGQTEAANALALSGFQRYRYVVLPQAFKIAIPPIINQFLNLTKNTSLGIAVAYAEITALTKTSIGNGRPGPQSILILMVVYLMFSFSISLVLNQVNRRFQTVGR